MYAGVPSTLPACDSSTVRAAPHRRDHAHLGPRAGAGGSSATPPSFEHLGQAPVHHLDLAEAAHHDVRRLQVAVDHAPGVGVGHRLADLLEDGQEPRAGRARVDWRSASKAASVRPLTSFMVK